MADTAAYLVDRVLPSAPYRQWVFTVPKALRLRLARDPAWATWVGNLAVRAIGAWQRRVARKRGLRARRPERSHSSKGSAAWSTGSVHFHLLVPDGVFIADEDRLAFALHPVPTSADVVAIPRSDRARIAPARVGSRRARPRVGAACARASNCSVLVARDAWRRRARSSVETREDLDRSAL
jgi:hypothetical protein